MTVIRRLCGAVVGAGLLLSADLAQAGERYRVGVAFADASGGVRVSEVRRGFAGHRAGLAIGDLVTAVDDESVRSVEELVAAIEGSGGRALALTVARADGAVTLPMAPEAFPDPTRDAAAYPYPAAEAAYPPIAAMLDGRPYAIVAEGDLFRLFGSALDAGADAPLFAQRVTFLSVIDCGAIGFPIVRLADPADMLSRTIEAIPSPRFDVARALGDKTRCAQAVAAQPTPALGVVRVAGRFVADGGDAGPTEFGGPLFLIDHAQFEGRTVSTLGRVADAAAAIARLVDGFGALEGLPIR